MKKIIIIISILLAAAAAWILAFPNKNPLKKIAAKTPGNQPISTNETIPGSFLPISGTTDMAGFPMSQGARGQLVKALQSALNNKYGSGLVVDGIFGPKTYKALSSNGYNADSLSYKEYLRLIG